MKQPAQQIVSTETSDPPKYRGVGGWLLLFIVSLTIITPAFQGYIVYNEWNLYRTTPSPLLFKILAVDWSMRVILIVFGIYAGLRLWLVKPGAPRVAKTYLIAVFAQQVVLHLMGFWIARLAKVAATPENIGRCHPGIAALHYLRRRLVFLPQQVPEGCSHLSRFVSVEVVVSIR